MANGILVNPASSGQPQVFTFSLTFTSDSWQQFWRCMMIGCVMSDHLINTKRSDFATQWNQLSTEVASLFSQGEVEPFENKTLNNC